MTNPAQHSTSGLGSFKTLAFATALFCVLTIVATQSAEGQTFTVLHSFNGGDDGGHPLSGLTMDRAGNFYGTASDGGAHQSGTVFKLTHSGAGWTLNPLYSFAGGNNDGIGPAARVVFGPNGSLYGTTAGGGPFGYGTIFNLRPPAKACGKVLCTWTETVLHTFPDPVGSDGFFPTGDLIFDQTGSIYGTAQFGPGNGCYGNGCGMVYKMTSSGGGWSESVVYRFGEAPDANIPEGGLILDQSGDFYGTACFGGSHNHGAVFQMTASGTEHVIYSFQAQSDGKCPAAGLIFNPAGNLYSTASDGGVNSGGTAFELMPSNGGWKFVLLYSFDFHALPSTLARDNTGNLYGTTYTAGAFGYGAVFELTPSHGGWEYTSLHDFTNGSDGANPAAGVALDANGNVYGTASQGAAQGCILGCGVVWEVTP